MVELVCRPTVYAGFVKAGLWHDPTLWPTGWRYHLCTDVLARTAENLSDVTEPTGGGYTTDGYALNQDDTDFPTHDFLDGVTEGHIGNFFGGYTFIKPLEFTAVTTNLSYRAWLLCDDDATPANRKIFGIADVGELRTIVAGQKHTWNIEIRDTVP